MDSGIVSIIFLLVELAVLLLFLSGAYHAARIVFFGSSSISGRNLALVRLGSLLSVFLIGFGIFYNPIINYLATSEILNLNGKIGSVQSPGTDFDGFLLVTDDGGAFMRGASVELSFEPYGNSSGKKVISGTTDDNGLLVLSQKIPNLSTGKYNLIISASSHGRERTANTQLDIVHSSLKIYSYSDRAIYKPGHTIHFAAYIWEKGESSFLPYSEKSANISVRNEKGLIVYRKELKTDSYGQIVLDFPISATANEGIYKIETETGQRKDKYEIEIQKYEKPTITLDIVAPGWIVRGDKPEVSYVATYLFGEPVHDAYLDVSAYPESSPYNKIGDTVKMRDGEYKYSVDTSGLYFGGASDRLIVEGKVTDTSGGEKQTEKKAIIVAESGLAFRMKSDRYIYTSGELVNIAVSALHPDGAPAQDVSAKITVKKYKNSQETVILSEDKTFSGTYNYVFNYPEDADYLKVDISGTSGRYYSSSGIYVNMKPNDYWSCRGRCPKEAVPGSYEKDIVIEPDKTEYGPGESAKISIYARSIYALKPAILEIRTPFRTTLKPFNMDKSAQNIIILDYEDISPVASVRAFVYNNVYNNGFLESESAFISASKDKELNVKLDYPKSAYEPGDVADIEINTGKPHSQVTFGVVDESIMLLKSYEFSPFAAMYSGDKRAVLNNIFTSNPYVRGDGGLYLIVGILILIVICGYALLLTYAKPETGDGNNAGRDKRFIILGIGGTVMFIITFILAIMNILREDAFGYLLFGASCVATIVSVLHSVYSSYIKAVGNRIISAVQVIGSLMAPVLLLLAILKIYSPHGEEFLLYIIIGLVLLLLSFGAELVKSAGWSKGLTFIIVGLVILAVVVGGLFLIIVTTGSMSRMSADIGTNAEYSPTKGIDYAMDRMGSPQGWTSGNAREESFKDKGAVPQGIQIRTNFPDTALWLPSIQADSSGMVRVPVRLPDTITSWRLEALAATKDAEIGSSKGNIISKKDFFVKSSIPSEATVGDEITVNLAVFNNLDKPVVSTVCVTSQASRCGVSSSKYDIVSGEPSATLTIPSHSSRSASWRVKFRGYGNSNITFLAFSKDNPSISDGMTRSVLIMPKEGISSVIYSGTVETGSQEFTIFDGAIKEFTSATLAIQPSLESVSLKSIESLAQYPHGCAEQTMSGLYPDILVKQYMVKSGQMTPEFEKKIDDMVVAGLQKLYNYRHSDGGWGWYENDQTNTYMTAYILYGLSEARNAGFFIDDDYFSGAEKLLSGKQRVDGSYEGTSHLSGKDMTMTAFVTYSMLNSGLDRESSAIKKASSYLAGKYDAGAMSDAYTIALYALILDRQGKDGERDVVLSKLESMKIVDGDKIYWDSGSGRYSYSLGGSATTTATVLLAMIWSQDQAYYSTIEKGIGWLVAARGSYGWGQTSDTAAAIKTISEYVRLSGESGDSQVSVYLNGNIAGTYDFTGDGRTKVYETALDYNIGRNTVKFQKSGSGKVYYTLTVKQADLSAGKDPVPSALSLSKRYQKNKANAGEKLPVTLQISSTIGTMYYLVIEDVVPPGFTVDEKSLEDLKASSSNVVEYEISGSNVYIYLNSLASTQTVTYDLKAVSKGLVFAPPAKAYAMYDPADVAESEAYSLEIS